MAILNDLKIRGKGVQLHWIPAHKEVIGNKKADVAAKMATGWRKKKKRNGKWMEVDSKFTAPLVQIPWLRSASNQVIKQAAVKEWEAEWKKEEKGKDLRRLMPVPSKSVLCIHGGVQKGFSALITQMRTGKIGLKHFLHSRKVPGFDSGTCDCRRDLQNGQAYSTGVPTTPKIEKRDVEGD